MNVKTAPRTCRFCGRSIRLDGGDSEDEILERGAEAAHRTCVYDQVGNQGTGMARGWRAIQWWGFAGAGTTGAVGRLQGETE